MATANVYYLSIALVFMISPSYCSCKPNCKLLCMSLPTSTTASDYALDSDFTCSQPPDYFDCPLMKTRFFLLPLLACHIMRSLHKMLLLPSIIYVQPRKKFCWFWSLFCRALIVLLLILSGNVHVHPGPAVTFNPILATDPGSDANSCLKDLNFSDFCSRKALGFLHINSRSLLPKIDQLKVWTHSSNPDILVVTESWLKNLCLTLLLISLVIIYFDKTGPLKVVGLLFL